MILSRFKNIRGFKIKKLALILMLNFIFFQVSFGQGRKNVELTELAYCFSHILVIQFGDSIDCNDQSVVYIDKETLQHAYMRAFDVDLTPPEFIQTDLGKVFFLTNKELFVQGGTCFYLVKDLFIKGKVFTISLFRRFKSELKQFLIKFTYRRNQWEFVDFNLIDE